MQLLPMSRAEQLDLGILIVEQVRDRRGQHLDRTTAVSVRATS